MMHRSSRTCSKNQSSLWWFTIIFLASTRCHGFTWLTNHYHHHDHDVMQSYADIGSGSTRKLLQGLTPLVSLSSSSSSSMSPTARITPNFNSCLHAETSSSSNNSNNDDIDEVDATSYESAPNSTTLRSLRGIDTGAVVKYFVAVGMQLGLITMLFQGLDRLVVPHVQIPFAVNVVGMYFLALKSRTFNPLSNRRPQSSTKEIENATQQRIMPSWTPPGVVFPIVWLLLIGPLRAITSAMIIQASGNVYTNPALLSLMLHLSIGDVWNTINNVEQRYGTSVLGVLCVWISAAFAVWQYHHVMPLAGKLLSLKLVWLTVASSLIIRTWQLNINPKTGRRSPLLPTKGDGETKLEWFS